jgi:predicted ATPase
MGGSLSIVTGPNFSGKSVYLKTVGERGGAGAGGTRASRAHSTHTHAASLCSALRLAHPPHRRLLQA